MPFWIFVVLPAGLEVESLDWVQWSMCIWWLDNILTFTLQREDHTKAREPLIPQHALCVCRQHIAQDKHGRIWYILLGQDTQAGAMNMSGIFRVFLEGQFQHQKWVDATQLLCVRTHPHNAAAPRAPWPMRTAPRKVPQIMRQGHQTRSQGQNQATNLRAWSQRTHQATKPAKRNPKSKWWCRMWIFWEDKRMSSRKIWGICPKFWSYSSKRRKGYCARHRISMTMIWCGWSGNVKPKVDRQIMFFSQVLLQERFSVFLDLRMDLNDPAASGDLIAPSIFPFCNFCDTVMQRKNRLWFSFDLKSCQSLPPQASLSPLPPEGLLRVPGRPVWAGRGISRLEKKPLYIKNIIHKNT